MLAFMMVPHKGELKMAGNKRGRVLKERAEIEKQFLHQIVIYPNRHNKSKKGMVKRVHLVDNKDDDGSHYMLEIRDEKTGFVTFHEPHTGTLIRL